MSNLRSLRTLQIGLEWETETYGGVDRVFAQLAAYLPEQGVSFTGVVAGSEDLPRMTDGRIHSIGAVRSTTWHRVRRVEDTVEAIVASRSIDLVATHFALYAFGAMRRIKDFPHVVHFHGPWASESLQEGGSRLAGFAKRQIERYVYDRADRVIVLSNSFAEVAAARYKVPASKIRVVPGSADIARFSIPATRAEARERLNWPSDKQIVLSVRRLSARMGLDRLILAWSQIKDHHPDGLLYIAGAGHKRQELEKQAAQLNLENRVRFLGFVPEDDLPFAYAAADVSVVPTAAWEGFGLVAAEALAAGTPPLVTPVGGLPEVVSALSPALVFASPETADIARGLSDALSGRISLPTRAECRDYAARHFSSSMMARRTASVYRELTGR